MHANFNAIQCGISARILGLPTGSPSGRQLKSKMADSHHLKNRGKPNIAISSLRSDRFCRNLARCTSRPSGPYHVTSQCGQSGPELHYSVDLQIQTYTEPIPIKYGKLATKCPWIYGYFYSVRQQRWSTDAEFV